MDTSSNPALSDNAFKRYDVIGQEKTMSVGGTLLKVTLAFFVLLLGAAWGWTLAPQLGFAIPWWTFWVGSFVSLAVGFWAVFNANPLNVLLYAALQGIYLGFISNIFSALYDGIVVQAILLTLTITLGMLFLYATGLVKVTRKLYSVILIATVGVLIYLVAEFFLSLFLPGFTNVVLSGPWGIVIAAIIVLIASLNLLLDFDTINRGVENKLGKKAEWYAAFGLMVTLIWLYVSILRLLAATRR
jgi:Predicted membrane protein